MRLIDADNLDETITRLNEQDWGITRNEYKLIDRVIFEMPTVNVYKTECEQTFDWIKNRVELAKAEINNAIESTFCTKDEAVGLGIALNVIDKYFTI